MNINGISVRFFLEMCICKDAPREKNQGGGGRLIHLVVMRRVVGDGETQRRRMEGDGKGRVGEVSDRGSDE